MASDALPQIEVTRLRIGMYVVLDVGWRNHPFAFSSFTIRTEAQLNQLRSLGPPKVRWSPERSTVGPLPAPAPETQPPAPVASPAGTPSPTVRGSAAPTAALERQETLLRQTETSFLRVAGQHHELLKRLQREPAEAHRIAVELGQTMVETIGDSERSSIRLLSQRVGFQASGHEICVTTLALMLARECGFSEAALQETALASLLHDIGKLRIPAFLHEDNGQLTDFERQTYRRHVEFSVELAQKMGLPARVIRAIAEHHEHDDGSGFPHAVDSDGLSPVGRVIAIANRYHNLVSPVHAEVGLSPHHALQRMYSVEKAHFDATFLPRFVRIMGVYPPGSLVELSDHRMAIVIASRPGAALSPRVQPIEAPDQDEPQLAFDLDADNGPRVQQCVRPEQLNPRWAQRARQFARAALYVEPLPQPAPAEVERRRPALAL